MEHLTKRTQNRWGSQLAAEFYALFRDYLSMYNDLTDKTEYRRLCWRYAYDTIELIHQMKRKAARKEVA